MRLLTCTWLCVACLAGCQLQEETDRLSSVHRATAALRAITDGAVTVAAYEERVEQLRHALERARKARLSTCERALVSQLDDVYALYADALSIWQRESEAPISAGPTPALADTGTDAAASRPGAHASQGSAVHALWHNAARLLATLHANPPCAAPATAS